MLAILTKILPATNTRPRRVKAYTCNGHQSTISYDYALHDVHAHLKAAQHLIRTQLTHAPAHDTMTYGGAPDGYVFTFTVSTITLTDTFQGD